MGVCLAIFLVGLVGLMVGGMLCPSCRLGLFCCFAGCIGCGILTGVVRWGLLCLGSVVISLILDLQLA